MNDYGRYEDRGKKNRPRRMDNTRGTVQPMSSQRRQEMGRSQKQDPAMRNRSAASTERRTDGSSRRSTSYRSSSSREGASYRSGGSRSGGRMMEDERARLRARARKKKRRRQRRMLLGFLSLLVVLLVGGAVYGFVGHQRETKKQELLKEGIRLLDEGNYDESITRLDEALQWSKGKVGEFETTVLMYRAEAEFRLEDYDAAMNTYGILRDTDEENTEYKKGIAYCMVKKEDYDSALALGVIDGYIYNLKAVEQINAGEYDAALELIARGKAAGDSLQDLMLNEAVAWENKGDFAKALELFEAYAAEYGTDENVEHELIFLRSRQGNGAAGANDTAGEGAPGSDAASQASAGAAGAEGSDGSGENPDTASEEAGDVSTGESGGSVSASGNGDGSGASGAGSTANGATVG